MIITREVEDRNPETRTLIAVDGEGWNIPLTEGETSANPAVSQLVQDKETGGWHPKGWHSYVMLAGADDRGFKRSLVHDGSRREAGPGVARNYGLKTTDCLDFLLDLPHDALVTSFAFSYDVTKLSADMPLQNLKELSNEGSIPEDEYLRRITEASDMFGFPIEQVPSIAVTNMCNLVDVATTIYDGYWIHYIPRKELEIIDLRAGKKLVQNTRNGRKYKPERKWIRRVRVWDGFGFFQKAFVGALKDYRCGYCPNCKSAREHCGAKCPVCAINNYCLTAPWTPDDIAHILAMKENRGAFKPEEQSQVLDYCYSECQYLSFLMRDLLTGINNFDPEMFKHMRRFDGSGSVASAYLTRHKVKENLPIRRPGSLETHRANGGHHCKKCRDTFRFNHCAYCGEDFPDITRLADHIDTVCMPEGIEPARLAGLPEEVALSGYFGGRFEVSEIGYMGNLYGYDINSAYPHITRYLPCLAHGHFERVTEYVSGVYGVYLCGSRTTGNYAPFPYRTNEKTPEGIAKSAIYYAHGGKRWVWSNANPELSEVEIARRHFGEKAIPIYDGYVWIAECDHKPFANIPELYELRKEYVSQGNGIEKVIKLILNSLYGKTAQSIGWSAKEGKAMAPPFQCFPWAGMITSGCRAMILNAVMQSDADVVSIATDGILSRTRITELDANAPKEKILGKWDYGENTDGYLFQSGVYCYTDSKGKQIFKTRGFSAKEITADDLITAWQAGIRTVHANPKHSRYIPMRGGVSRDNALEYIGQWVPSIHDVSFTHNRRIPVLDYDEYGDIRPGLERYSTPAVMGCRECKQCLEGNGHLCDNPPTSAPYVPKQTWEDVLDSQAGIESDYLEDNGDIRNVRE